MTASQRSRAFDIAIVLVGSALTVSHFASDPVAGPAWLVYGWFLLLDVPLLWRRSHPLAASRSGWPPTRPDGPRAA